ncbi:hypothetical protein F6V25_07855 [Oryzomonas japonica]|uniref:Uncharacterized protein n=1 Tax=Oryzomonas japonica TaxID=2603858 RepID=A0A7J4ZRQ3_9BACT|nr:hypothetical protein [Oryzomonas japonica]KAB0665627.1 hypothetical protein F6V25_07855 [Oryzomonas japonica]
MLIVDYKATQDRIKDRCVAITRVAEKFGINKTSLQKFVEGRFFGTSGQGVYGDCEQAMIAMDLLVYSEVEDVKRAA